MHRRPTPPAKTPSTVPAAAAPQRASPWLGLAAMLLLLAVGLYFALQHPGTEPWPPGTEAVPPGTTVAAVAPGSRPAAEPAPAPTYVGGAACVSCHAREAEAWQGSHHHRAMAVATPSTVLGRFDGTTFRHQGVTSTFFRRGEKFFVHTDGPDGKPADFEITHTFGVAPLQQVLVPLPGGRLQALGIAWDARPKSQGGQRWFHLYPDRRLKAGDARHWTGIDQTWNYQCADCHSTNLRKNYDESSDTYATTWTDIHVSCEACHGPSSNHVAWAQPGREAQRAAQPAKGLTVALDERRGVSWVIDTATGNPTRSAPRTTSREIETCARCHARRGQFSDTWHAGRPLAEGFRVALIEPGLYHDDGQQLDEVFNHGSFLGSRMHAQGVTCSDCHDPHSGRTRLAGNAVCAACHLPARFDAPAHYHHAAGSNGAACAGCHMPTTTYMVVDPRHDHGFRIPRPDRTASLGVPNACNACHADRTPAWAAAAVAAWFPQPRPGFQTFAEAFAAARRGAPGSAQALATVATDRAQPGIVRASAVERLAGLARRGVQLGPDAFGALRQALGDADALVRAAATRALSSADARLRAQLLPPLLGDPVREVRMAAARALAGALEAGIAPQDRAAFDAALAEAVAAERFNADRPEGRANLGNLYAAQGRPETAIAAFRSALALDPSFIEAALNLADLQRQTGAEADAERTLRAALQRDPRSAPVHHALGLALTRQQRRDEALRALAQAARLDPATPRYAYAHAVALNDAGQGAQARRELEQSLKRHPYDRETLLALTLFERDAGLRERALGHARRLAELAPDDPGARQLVRELESGPR